MKFGNQKLVYEFAKTEGGEEIGFNDSVTTTFKGHPAYSLARESIQNIIDAVDDTTKPVIAEFRFKKINAHELPSHEQLAEIFEACKKYYSNNQSSVDFFSKAHKVLKTNDEIGILTVADYNTKGMTGEDDDINGNYYNFLKSSGASPKVGGSGGSFGLGKGAYYAASSFHSIFVSSIYGKNKHVFQGKLRLVTHERNGDKYQSTGSFGYTKQAPVRNPEDIPALFKRTQKGTDISIIGFYETANWEKVITLSVLTNFWLAILKNTLIVRIDDFEISSSTLEKLMFDNFKEIEKETDDLQNPLQPYLAYVSENNVVFPESLPTLGKVYLKILPKENYNKRISFFRATGMQIKKIKYPLPNPFAGVFECDNEEGNTILRAMENPQHDQWDPENAREKTEDIYKKAQKAEKEVKEFIRNSLRQIFSAKDDVELNIPGLSKYLFIQTQEDPRELEGAGSNATDEKGSSSGETAREVGADSNDKKEVELAHQIIVIKKSAKVSKKGKQEIEIETGGSGGEGIIDNLEEKGGEDPAGGKTGRLLKNVALRSYAIVGEDGMVAHEVVMHGPAGTKVSLRVAAGTDDSLGSVIIKGAENSEGLPLDVDGDKVSKIKIGDKGSEKIILHFEDNDRYALNIQPYEDK